MDSIECGLLSECYFFHISLKSFAAGSRSPIPSCNRLAFTQLL